MRRVDTHPVPGALVCHLRAAGPAVAPCVPRDRGSAAEEHSAHARPLWPCMAETFLSRAAPRAHEIPPSPPPPSCLKSRMRLKREPRIASAIAAAARQLAGSRETSAGLAKQDDQMRIPQPSTDRVGRRAKQEMPSPTLRASATEQDCTHG